MANKIKAFATNENANVLSDTELENRQELQTGFAVKSKADSALVGKLFQDTSAIAYAVGEFTAKNTGLDVSGANASALAANFESALGTFVEEKAPTPDLSNYVVKETVGQTNRLKYKNSNASGAPNTTLSLLGDNDGTSLLVTAIAKDGNTATLTLSAVSDGTGDMDGTDTKLDIQAQAIKLNGTKVATVDQIPDTSNLVTKDELAAKITASTTDLTAGSSPLATGAIYLVYE